MPKVNIIDADYLGVRIYLTPGMLSMLVDIISLSLTPFTFKQPDTWKHPAFIAKDFPYLCSTFLGDATELFRVSVAP